MAASDPAQAVGHPGARLVTKSTMAERLSQIIAGLAQSGHFP